MDYYKRNYKVALYLIIKKCFYIIDISNKLVFFKFRVMSSLGETFSRPRSQKGKIMNMTKMNVVEFFDCKQIGMETLALKMEECRRNFKDCFAALDTGCVFKMDGLIHKTLASIPSIPFPDKDILKIRLDDVLDEDEFNHVEVRRLLTDIRIKLDFSYSVVCSCFSGRFDFI